MGPFRRLIAGLVVVSAAIPAVLVAAHPTAPASALGASSIHGRTNLTAASTLCGASGGPSCGTSSGPSCGISCGTSAGPSCGISCGTSAGPSCGPSAGPSCTGTQDGTYNGPACGPSAGPSCPPPNCVWVLDFSGAALCARPPPPLCLSSAGLSCPPPASCGPSAGPTCPPSESVVRCLPSADPTCIPIVVVLMRCRLSAGTACRPMGRSCPASAGPPCGIPKCVVSCRQLQVTPSQVPPGGTITVTGDDDARCNKPGSKATLVRLFLGNQAVDVIGSGGRFSVRVTLPAGASAGNYPVSAECYGQSRGATTRPIAWRVVTVNPPAHSSLALVALVGGGGGGLLLVILLLLWALVARKGKRRRNVAWVKEHLRAVPGSSPGSPSAKIRRRPGARSISLGLEPHDDHLGNQKT